MIAEGHSGTHEALESRNPRRSLCGNRNNPLNSLKTILSGTPLRLRRQLYHSHGKTSAQLHFLGRHRCPDRHERHNGLGDDVGAIPEHADLERECREKFFPNERGELLLTAYDLSDENKSINRRVAETYIEETTSRVLPWYFMLTFTYNLRHFSPS